MRIEASCGKAPKTASLQDTVYSLKLTAQTNGEKRWLAGLLKAIPGTAERIVLTGKTPIVTIDTNYN